LVVLVSSQVFELPVLLLIDGLFNAQFVGRERDLKFLEGVYSSGELELLVVYCIFL
jgi:hypothetical protein